MEDNSVSSPLPDSDKEAKCHPRLTQYKTSSKSNTLNQEERRWQLLQDQKRKRDECFNASRGLIEQLESLSQEQDQMEYTNIKIKPKLVEFYRNRLMLSEWLEHVPEDLADNWFIVPCPIGRRSLVVACGGLTRTFSKGGIHITTFKSALPGGNSEDPKRSTLIDCIWSSTNHTYYVLDVLVWGSHPLLDCETEFRFFWLKNKLEEDPQLSEKNVGVNTFPFASLPYHLCDPSMMTNMMAKENMFGEKGPGLDGLLFYHSKTHYVPGKTPLVGWLKPHMLPARLGITVAPVYEQEEMETVHKPKRRHRYRKHCSHGKEMNVEEINIVDSSREMEISGLDDTETDSKESSIEEMQLNCCSENCVEEMEPLDCN